MAAAPPDFNRDELKTWLRTKPTDVSVALAARIALRLMPNLVSLARTEESRRDLILPLLRGMNTTWASTTIPTHGVALRTSDTSNAAGYASAAASASALPADADAASAASAADAASSAAYAAAPDAAAAAATAADASAAVYAASAATVAYVAVGRALLTDRQMIDGGMSARALLRLPLCHEDTPGFAAEWAEMTALLRAHETDEHWSVWIDWYQARLRGDPINEDLEIARLVEVTDKEWEQGPAIANARIKEIIERFEAGGGEDGEGEKPSRKTRKVELTESVAINPSGAKASTDSDHNDLQSGPAEEAHPDPPPEPELIESVSPHSDEPTADDQLGRQPFARALVERMEAVHKQGGVDGFAVNMHAPWGAGKTSVLRMMEAIMTEPSRELHERWAIVHFNAWQHERRNPPWWPFLETIKDGIMTGARDNHREEAAIWIWLRWNFWKVRADWLPYVVGLIIGVGLIYLLWFTDLSSTLIAAAKASAPAPPDGEASHVVVDVLDTWEPIFSNLLKVVTALVTVVAGFIAAGRLWVFGSPDNAKFYADLSRDPLKRIRGLFDSVVRQARRPVCVFIDDLDRCNADYVVSLLEGIQTCFRHRKVSYVVAADRTWIRASFEDKYKTFTEPVGDPGQPLGYLFLEKIFQISTTVPGMGERRRKRYWSRLLGETGGEATPPADPVLEGSDDPDADLQARQAAPELAFASFDKDVAFEREQLKSRYKEGLTRGLADAALSEHDSDARRAAVALELSSSSAADREIRHALARFADILPDNPRVMKRMINAYSMRQAIGILEDDGLSADTLARWTILEQRYPAVADLLADRASLLETLIDAAALNASLTHVPPILHDHTLRTRILAIVGEGEDDALTVDHVRSLTRGAAA